MAPEATAPTTNIGRKNVMTTQAIARRWWHRGNANHGWLRSFFTFSFANYYDPSFESFSNLRVINEDRVAPQTGFPTHAHSNAEIFSYILSGELTHRDSMNNVETLKRGEVQFTSAGSGIRHSEYNNHPSNECHFLQIWYTPDQRNLPPKYYTIPHVPDTEKTDRFKTLIKEYKTFSSDELKVTGLLPEGRAIPAHSSLSTRVSILTPGGKVSHTLGSETIQKDGERWAYLHLAMTSGYKDKDAFEARIRKDMAGYSKHDDRLARAARFGSRVYGTQANVKITQLKDQAKPRLTLTYAQSKDGKIAGPGKKMVALSGQESMIMTHSLRTVHEGILVGIGTLLNDNPQLNARLLNPLQGGKEVAVDLLPRPIILDTKLRIPLSCKLLTNAKAGTGKAPLIITAKGQEAAKADELRSSGAEIVEVESQDGLLPWKAVMDIIYQAGIKSVMVEGGATIIESLFAEHEKSSIIDELIVTVAPVSLGEQALGYFRPNWLSKALNLPSTSKAAAPSMNELRPVNLEPEIFNKDFVLAWSKQPICNEARIKVQGQTLEEGDGIFIKRGKVGDEITVENVGSKSAEVVLFDLAAGDE